MGTKEQIIAELAGRHVPFFRIGGTLEDRISQVNEVLSRHTKFCNLPDLRRTFSGSPDNPSH